MSHLLCNVTPPAREATVARDSPAIGTNRGTVIVATARSSAPSAAHQLPMPSGIGVRFASQPRAAVAVGSSSSLVSCRSFFVDGARVSGRCSLTRAFRFRTRNEELGTRNEKRRVAPRPHHPAGRFLRGGGPGRSALSDGRVRCSIRVRRQLPSRAAGGHRAAQTERKDCCLTFGELAQRAHDGFLDFEFFDREGGIVDFIILNEVSEDGAVLTNGSLQRGDRVGGIQGLFHPW